MELEAALMNGTHERGYNNAMQMVLKQRYLEGGNDFCVIIRRKVRSKCFYLLKGNFGEISLKFETNFLISFVLFGIFLLIYY